METLNRSAGLDNLSNVGNHLTDYPEVKLLRTLLYSSMAVLGITLNIGTIITVRKGRSFKKKGIKLLLTNKSLADLLTSLTFPVAYALKPYWPYPTMLALFILASIASFAIYTSLLWNTVLSVERFVAVYFPLRTLTNRKRSNGITCVFVWLVAFTAALTCALMSLADCNNDSLLDLQVTSQCALMFHFDRHNEDLMKFAAVPCVIILIMYCLVTFKVCRRKMVKSMHLSIAGRQQILNVQKRVTAMIMVDALVSFITWMPWRQLCKICSSSMCHPTTYTILFGLWMSNSFMTPIIYYTLNKSFRVRLFRPIF